MSLRVAAVIALVALTSSALGKEPPAETTPTGFPHAVVVLLRDRAVQEELRLNNNQKKVLRAAIAQVDEPLWLLRDVPPREAWDKTRPLLQLIENTAQDVLD